MDKLDGSFQQQDLKVYHQLSSEILVFSSFQELFPLTSLLEISDTISGLNGTRIECTTIDGMETTVITIIGNGKLHPDYIRGLLIIIITA